jgi:hypothetical protein
MPDDHPMLAVVGQIASQWAHIEHVLDTIIWKLVGAEPKTCACITAQLAGPYARFKTIISLANILGLDAKTVKRITELQYKIQERAEKRHRIVHDPWYSDVSIRTTRSDSDGATTETSDDNIAAKLKPSPAQFKSVPFKNYDFGLQKSEVEYLEKAIEEGKQTFDRVNELRDAIMDAIESSNGRR